MRASEESMSPKPISENTLFYGDNLFILREHIPSESVDLIYLDPPFNSSRNYNVCVVPYLIQKKQP
jgi:DNA modification methylase